MKTKVLWGGVIISFVLNLALMGALFISEMKGHTFSLVLERKGLISLQDQAHPDYWAIHGWTNTLEKLNIDVDVAFFGNSITRGSDFQSYFPDKKIINLGYSGDNILGMCRRIPMLQVVNPDKIFIMAGTNDLVNIGLEEYRERYLKLISSIKDSIPNATIYIQSVLPTNSVMGDYAPNTKVQKANLIAQEISDSYGCVFIDLYSLYVNSENEMPAEYTRDGVHLYPQHYDKWANALSAYLSSN